MEIQKLLEEVKVGAISIEEAKKELVKLPMRISAVRKLTTTGVCEAALAR